MRAERRGGVNAVATPRGGGAAPVATRRSSVLCLFCTVCQRRIRMYVRTSRG